MSAPNGQPNLHQDCLAKLDRALDLVLQSAEAAAAENNHKVVLQAAREVARIVTLINKMTVTNAKPEAAFMPGTAAAGRARAASPGGRRQPTAFRPQPPGAKPQAAAPAGNPDLQPADLLLPDLDALFPPGKVASWDGETQALFGTMSRSYQELQAIGAEMAASLEGPATGNGSKA
jgi:hypothetical protein